MAKVGSGVRHSGNIGCLLISESGARSSVERLNDNVKNKCRCRVKLYYQGWNTRSISRFLHISPSTVHLWIARFEAEQCTGLVDHSRAPKAPARKVWLPLMLEVY